MDNNTWFYTLSTIAQVMAAIAGLFAVFVVFRTDKLNNHLTEFRAMVVGAVHIDGHQVFQMPDKDLLQKGREYLESEVAKNESMSFSGELGSFTFGKETLDIFEKLNNGKDDILNKLKWAIVLSLSCISVSIGFLVWSDYLSLYAFYLLPIIFVFTVLTLGYIGIGVYELNKNQL